jgi:hypothetical protein
METVAFTCDHCGTRFDEEVAGLNKPHCSLEIVLRGQRFMPATVLRLKDRGAGAVYGIPVTLELSEIENERWGTSLCDRCTKRLAYLLGLKLETPEEHKAQQDELARRTADAFNSQWPGGTPAGQHGKLVTQFPTEPAPTMATLGVMPSVTQTKTRKTASAKRKKSR